MPACLTVVPWMELTRFALSDPVPSPLPFWLVSTRLSPPSTTPPTARTQPSVVLHSKTISSSIYIEEHTLPLGFDCCHCQHCCVSADLV
jgi:hypothetical protein